MTSIRDSILAVFPAATENIWYQDDEGDIVTLATAEDLAEALRLAAGPGPTTLRLRLEMYMPADVLKNKIEEKRRKLSNVARKQALLGERHADLARQLRALEDLARPARAAPAPMDAPIAPILLQNMDAGSTSCVGVGLGSAWAESRTAAWARAQAGTSVHCIIILLVLFDFMCAKICILS